MLIERKDLENIEHMGKDFLELMVYKDLIKFFTERAKTLSKINRPTYLDKENLTLNRMLIDYFSRYKI